MNGTVLSHHVLLAVSLQLPEQPDLLVEFVVDTGFVGELTLPEEAVRALGLRPVREISANLADDSAIVVTAHRATILWHGEERAIEVLTMGKNPLLGMRLLDGSEMNIQFADGGLVSLDIL